MAISAKDILWALRDGHESPGWLFFPELRLGTGYAVRDNGRKILSEVESHMDAFAMHTYRSKQYQRVAYEIKVSQSDFIREMRQPLKRRPALMVSNLFYFVAPEGVLKPEDMPQECGLLIVKERPEDCAYHPIKELVPAPWRDTEPAPWHFVASLGRRIAKVERQASDD